MSKNEITIDENGTKRHYKDGKLHREDGPAVEWYNGSKEWWINGKRHREDGPAIEYVEKFKSWWIDGKRHREDGPAVIYSDNGPKKWYVDGKQCSEKNYSQALSSYKTRLLSELLSSCP